MILIKTGKLYKTLYNTDGFAIGYVLFIVLIITTLLFSLFGYLIISKRMEIKRVIKKQIDLACYSSVQLILSDTIGAKDYVKNIKIDSITVRIEKKYYGLFYRLTAAAKYRNDSSKYQCFVGTKPDTAFNNAVVITNPNLTGVLADNTVINGDILTATNRFTKERIQGKNNGINAINGKFKRSDKIKQKYFNEEIIARQFLRLIKTEFDVPVNGDFRINESNINQLNGKIIKIDGNVTISGNLFSKYYSTVTIKCQGQFRIKDSTRSNVYFDVSCDSNAIIAPHCKISNLALFTEAGITVNPGSVFENLQIYSKNDIRINESLFNYPSVISLYNNELQKKPNKELQITKSKVTGTVMLISKFTGMSVNRSKLKIDYASSIKGLVYSENLLETGSSIFGSACFYNLYYYKDPTEYINWLTDLHINRYELETDFLLPVGFNENKRFDVLFENWIY